MTLNFFFGQSVYIEDHLVTSLCLYTTNTQFSIILEVIQTKNISMQAFEELSRITKFYCTQYRKLILLISYNFAKFLKKSFLLT